MTKGLIDMPSPDDRHGCDPRRRSGQLADRERLVAATIELEPTGQVPIVHQAEAFSPRFMGHSIADYAPDPDVAVESTLGAMDRLGDFDAINSVPGDTSTWASPRCGSRACLSPEESFRPRASGRPTNART
jgi:hypothetical protein